MIRARFKVNPSDYRPVIWPIKHPYWCTGASEEHFILVAYADDEDEIMSLWPDAEDIDAEESTSYAFSDRFPPPKWFTFHQ